MKIKIKRDLLSKIYFSIYLFFSLFAPPLLPDINIIIPLSIISLLILIFRYQKEFYIIIKSKILRNFILFIILYLFYLLSIILFNILIGEIVNITHYITFFYSFFLVVPTTLIVCIYIVSFCLKKRWNFDELITMFVIAGFFQGLITICTIISNNIKIFFVNLMYKNTNEVKLTSSWLIERRFYGFANSMLDLFGLGTGIIASLPLFLYRIKRKIIYFIPTLLIVPFMNSRTGLVIFAIALIMILIQIFFHRKKVSDLILIIALIIVIIMLILYMSINSPETISWILNDFSSFFSDTEGTATNLFSKNFWQIPNNIFHFFCGTGHSLYLASGYSHSDVGYINDLWRQGIIGTILLYGAFFYLWSKGKKKSSNQREKNIFNLIMISFIVFLIKGSLFTYHPAMIIFFSTTIFKICFNDYH